VFCLLLLLFLASCDAGATTPRIYSTVPPISSSDWTTYHANPARTGYLANMPDPHNLTPLWQQSLDGSVYAEPLVVNGRVIVVTENDTFYALDATTGAVQWHTNVGVPVARSILPCGDIDPLGITGTPVYDPQTGLVFAVAEVQGFTHLLVGVNVTTGQVKVRRPIDPPGIDARVEQERSALALANGLVYVAFGGLAGDCGDYHGLIVASRPDGTGPLLTYQVPTPREGGIWTPPGPSIDAQGNLYVSVGNGAVTQGDWDYSDSILRLSPSLQLEDGFAPTSWQQENATDADLGSMGPVLLPNGLLYANGKSGEGYLLQANQLGGVGGQLQALHVCVAFGGAAVRGQSLFIPCSDGVRQLQLSGVHLSTGWHAAQQINGSPVVGGQTVYSLDSSDGILYALDAATGTVRASITVGQTTRFATPTLYQSSIFVGTQNGIVAVGVA
jgi:YVTN family beta-propeller protein